MNFSRFLYYAFIPWPALLGQNTSLLNDGASIKLSIANNCKHAAGKQVITAKVAHTDQSREKGLSDIHKPLPKNEGMIFIFDQPQQVGFWMKRTFIPLQIIYITPQGKTFGTQEMPVEPNPDNPQKIFYSPGPAIAAIELNPKTVSSPDNKALCVEVKKSTHEK